jgi:hypothetical protein
MIKRINPNNLLTTPFVAAKEWSLYNVQNDDVILMEGDTEEPLAMDYVDYYGDSPLLNRNCNIALEQQDSDLVNYQEAEKRTGLFYPEQEERNNDGSYKRLVWNQTNAAFYNTFNNPTQIFGLEHIDFPLGKTNRFISEFFRIFNIPRKMFGDKIVEGSVRLYDNILDDDVTITDDGYSNLIAKRNIFSKIQELRSFGVTLHTGSIETSCPVYT